MTKTDILDPVVLSVDEKKTKVGRRSEFSERRRARPPRPRSISRIRDEKSPPLSLSLSRAFEGSAATETSPD